MLTLTDFFLPCNRINLVNLRGKLCDEPEQGRRCAKDCKVPPWDTESLGQRHRQAAAVLASACACVAPSAYVADRYRAAFDGLPVQVIPHGIDLLALLRHAAPTAAPPAGAKLLTLGYVGTIVPQKGLQVLLQALAAIPDVPLRLLVAGGLHGDAAHADSIHRMVAADPRVQLLGQLDAVGVGAMLGTIDLLCLPSIVPESFSLVLRESAALGVPALVSQLGAPAELMAETGAGLALPAGDSAAWAQAIAQVQGEPAVLERWRAALPLPLRVEEEAFLYESLYRQFRKAG